VGQGLDSTGLPAANALRPPARPPAWLAGWLAR
jgi:hypothetical protein